MGHVLIYSSYDMQTVNLEKNENFHEIDNTPIDSNLHPLDTSVIFGIGTGVHAEDIPHILEIAEKIKASVGATRRVVDMGRIPRQFQIGLTGMSISPSLYIALGISGSDNHIVGIRYAGKVIAVNNNPDADIFKHSDFGMIMDTHEFIENIYKFVHK